MEYDHILHLPCRERNIVDQVNKISQRFQDGIRAFSDSPIIGEVYIICQETLSLWLIECIITNITLWYLQIRGVGLILGTEFTDNKSPNDPFPPEWGRFKSILIFHLSLFETYLIQRVYLSFSSDLNCNNIVKDCSLIHLSNLHKTCLKYVIRSYDELDRLYLGDFIFIVDY